MPGLDQMFSACFLLKYWDGLTRNTLKKSPYLKGGDGFGHPVSAVITLFGGFHLHAGRDS